MFYFRPTPLVRAVRLWSGSHDTLADMKSVVCTPLESVDKSCYVRIARECSLLYWNIVNSQLPSYPLILIQLVCTIPLQDKGLSPWFSVFSIQGQSRLLVVGLASLSCHLRLGLPRRLLAISNCCYFGQQLIGHMADGQLRRTST